MASTPEKKVKLKVRAILDWHDDVYYFTPMSGGYGRSGVPDIVGCYKGVFFGIECKANGGKPTALQVKNLTQIIKAGGKATIINENNLEDVRLMLSTIDYESDQKNSSI
jgi:Holliday junction resolvase